MSFFKPAIYGSTIPWPQFLGLFRCFHLFWHLFCRFHSRPSPVSRLVSDGCVEMVPGCRPSFGTLGVLCGPTNWAARRQPIGQPIDVGWRWMTMPTKSYKHHWIWLAAGDMDSDERHWKTHADLAFCCYCLLLKQFLCLVTTVLWAFLKNPKLARWWCC